MKFRCTTCGAPAVSVRPGTEALVCAGITVRRGEPDKAWCMTHLLHQFGERQRDLFGGGQ